MAAAPTQPQVNQQRTVTYRIDRELGVLSVSKGGWTRELNVVSWNGRDPKYDIRDWAPGKEKMSRGITLNDEEMQTIVRLVTQTDDEPDTEEAVETAEA